jgi:protein ImuB
MEKGLPNETRTDRANLYCVGVKKMFACIYLPGMPESGIPRIIDCAFAFSPRVEQITIDTFVLDVGGSNLLFGSASEICRLLAESASEVWMPVRISVAHNLESAVHSARGFSNHTVVPASQEGRFLSPLPLKTMIASLADVEELRGNEVVEILALWGIRTFGEFAALPGAGVSERLGEEGLRLQKLARGEGNRHLNPLRPTPGYSQKAELEHAISFQEPLLFILASLTNQLCVNLNANGLAASEMRIHMRLENGSEYNQSISLAIPIKDPRLLLKMIEVELEANPPDSGVTSVTLSADPVKPRIVQKGLFIPIAPEPEKLELQLARLARLAGKQNVGSAELIDTHRPQAFRLNRFRLADKRPRTKPTTAAKAIKPVLALSIFRPPLKARVTLDAGRPVRMSATGSAGLKGVQGKVLVSAGPWHSSGDWWSSEPWSRSEWDVELDDGGVYRIYHDCSNEAWFVEGMYD